MARKNGMKKMAPAQTKLTFFLSNEGASGRRWIDLAQCLSAVNRRLYRAGKHYYVSSIKVGLIPSSDTAGLQLSTIPDTWVTNNAWKKSFALWNDMNKNVLADNPSVQGKWADFKIFMSKTHLESGTVSSAGPQYNILPVDASGNAIKANEWYMARYVSPQHDVDPATGEPLPADEYYCHMLGADSGTQGAYSSVGLVDGYSKTRAMVQIAPDVPALMQDNWMTELSDLGGQDPELANVIEDANDNPPYDIDEYPGSGTNFPEPVWSSFVTTTTTIPVAYGEGFKVPFGLIQVDWSGAGAGNILQIELLPGDYKGVAVTEVN